MLCDSAACAAADPKAAGCTCRAVLAAQDLKKIGVKTFVVGFSGDVSIGTGKAANDKGGVLFEGLAAYVKDKVDDHVKDERNSARAVQTPHDALEAGVEAHARLDGQGQQVEHRRQVADDLVAPPRENLLQIFRDDLRLRDHVAVDI